MSHNSISWFPLPARKYLPSLGTAIESTDQTLGPSSVDERPHLPASQTRIVSSFEPDNTRVPSGVIATQLTSPLCPDSVARHSPVSRSQILTVLSCEPDAAQLPSGPTATLLTSRSCPVNFRWGTANGSVRCGFFSGLPRPRGSNGAAGSGASASGPQAASSSSSAASPSSR